MNVSFSQDQWGRIWMWTNYDTLLAQFHRVELDAPYRFLDIIKVETSLSSSKVFPLRNFLCDEEPYKAGSLRDRLGLALEMRDEEEIRSILMELAK